MLSSSTILLSADAIDADAKIIEEIIKLLVQCPPALITVVLACLSGHLWTYIIIVLCNYSKKEKKILNETITKIAFGMLWFALVYILFQVFVYGSCIITLENVLNSLLSVVVIALAVQFVIMVIVCFCNRKGRR